MLKDIADLTIPPRDDSWRTQAYCPHHREEQVTRVVHAKPLFGGATATYEALVAFECGTQVSIITTAKNLFLMEGHL